MNGLVNNLEGTELWREQIKAEFALRELKRAIGYGCVRCLTVQEIIDRICDPDRNDEGIDYVQRLHELQLTDSDFEHIATAMNGLAERSERAPSKSKARIDRKLLRLVRLLPSELACHFAEPFVDHPRKARREWAYAALRKKQISKTVATKLLQNFSKTADQEALNLIARNPERAVDVDVDLLLANLEERYWRARVIQALITLNRRKALSVSRIYPFEFAHAVGRAGDVSMLEALRVLFLSNSHDAEFLAIYAYALGKLGCRTELDSLDQFIREKWPNLL
jgi:hypothetical protein